MTSPWPNNGTPRGLPAWDSCWYVYCTTGTRGKPSKERRRPITLSRPDQIILRWSSSYSIPSSGAFSGRLFRHTVELELASCFVPLRCYQIPLTCSSYRHRCWLKTEKVKGTVITRVVPCYRCNCKFHRALDGPYGRICAHITCALASRPRHPTYE